jgi:hypothetical protein
MITTYFFIFIFWLRCQNPCPFSGTNIATTQTSLFNLIYFTFLVAACKNVAVGSEGVALTQEFLYPKQTAVSSVRFSHVKGTRYVMPVPWLVSSLNIVRQNEDHPSCLLNEQAQGRRAQSLH